MKLNRHIIDKERRSMREYLLRLNRGFQNRHLRFHVFASEHSVERMIMRGFDPAVVVRAIDYALSSQPGLVKVGKEIRIKISNSIIVLKVNLFDKEQHFNYIIGLVTVFDITKDKTYCFEVMPHNLINYKHGWKLPSRYHGIEDNSVKHRFSRNMTRSSLCRFY